MATYTRFRYATANGNDLLVFGSEAERSAALTRIGGRAHNISAVAARNYMRDALVGMGILTGSFPSREMHQDTLTELYLASI